MLDSIVGVVKKKKRKEGRILPSMTAPICLSFWHFPLGYFHNPCGTVVDLNSSSWRTLHVKFCAICTGKRAVLASPFSEPKNSAVSNKKKKNDFQIALESSVFFRSNWRVSLKKISPIEWEYSSGPSTLYF